MMADQIFIRQPGQATLLHERHGFGRIPEPAPGTRLHLDEDQHGTVAGDDVQFSTADSESASNNCVPSPLELPAREIFTAFP